MQKQRNIKAYVAWLLICIIWGTTYLAIRIGVKDLPPVLFAGFRWLFAGTILLVFLLMRGYALPKGKDFLHITIIGICLIGIGNGLVVYSELTIPSGLAALLITTTPFWFVLFEWLLPRGKRINMFTLSGILLGFIGIGIIFGGDVKNLFDRNHLIGVISLMLAVIGWAVGSIYSKYKKINVHPLMSASVQMIIAGLILTILAAGLGEFNNLILTKDGLLAFLYLLIVGSLVGYASYIYAIAHLPVSFVSTYAYINPIIALFLGWLILNETISANIIIASVIIFAGVILVKRGTEKT